MLGIACESARCSSPERAARGGEQSVLVCSPGTPVESLFLKAGCLLHADGRPEPRDADGLTGSAVGACRLVGREPLIAAVSHQREETACQ